MTDQIIQLQAQVAELELKIEQLTASRDQARRCSRVWKGAAKRWRQKATQNTNQAPE